MFRMKKLLYWILSIFRKKTKTPPPSKTPLIVLPTPTPSEEGRTVFSYNVNGFELDIQNVCNTGVVTIFSKCNRLEFGCYVFSNYECTEFKDLIGKHFHDYMNDVVYQIQEDGMIVNLGRCNL
jgi:hypothetical protein